MIQIEEIDLMDEDTKSQPDFLKQVFNHILLISKGECEITDNDLVLLEDSEEKRNILAGLKLLHEDLELYKADYKQNLDSEYSVKILQKKNTELEQFNYMASHDLKEPLRSIRSFSDLLLRKQDSLGAEDMQSYLKFIADASTRMYQLIEGLLSFSTAGAQLNKTKVDVETILTLLLNDLRSLIKSNEVEVNISEMPKIYADPTSIRLIFQNLISNAVKFRSPDRKLQIQIEGAKTDQGYTFSVQDNGIGIEKEYQDKIFNLLTRLHSKAEIEGAGIGLSICKKLVELHNGSIKIDPEYTKGARFVFTIPGDLYSNVDQKASVAGAISSLKI